MTASIERMERAAVAWVAALAVALGARAANAAPLASNAPPEPSEAQLATARGLYRDAELLRRQDKLDEALARIEAAYRTVRTPVIALELAKIRQQLGHFASAYTASRAAETMAQTGRETEKSREARREAGALATTLRDRVGIVRVMLPTVLTDAEVRVDGDAVNVADEIVVDAGTHGVVLLVDGRACTTTSVALREGDARALDLRERALACMPDPAPAEPDLAPRDRESSASPVPSPPSHADPAPPMSRGAESLSTSRWVAIGLMSAGAVSIAAGGYLGVRAKADYDSVAIDCPGSVCTPYAFDVRQAARAHATGATYAIVLGLGAAAGGLTLWLVDPSSDRASPPRVGRVGIRVSPASVGMTVLLP